MLQRRKGEKIRLCIKKLAETGKISLGSWSWQEAAQGLPRPHSCPHLNLSGNQLEAFVKECLFMQAGSTDRLGPGFL